MGFSRGPIPPSEVIAYMDRFHPWFDIDDAFYFLDLVTRMDDRYLEFFSEKDKEKERDKGSNLVGADGRPVAR